MPMPRGTNASKDKCLDLWVQAFVRTKCGCRHLSSWHLSEPKVGPGICPNQKWVLTFVQTKSGSWHLSDPKNGPGICPN